MANSIADLCIDTSYATAVALVRSGERSIRAIDDRTRYHAETLTPLVRQVLAEGGYGQHPGVGDELTAVCVGTGPAPFTGLRAGLITARVCARMYGIPLYGVPSLDIVARTALDLLAPDQEIVVASDARRREFYWARYRAQGPDDVTRAIEPRVGSAQQLANELRDSRILLVLGTPLPEKGAEELMHASVGPSVTCDPAQLSRIIRARLARGVSPQELGTEPLYMRRPDIQGQPTQAL